MRTVGARDKTSRISECSRCGCPEAEWTPGCKTCRERRRLRARRSGDPAQLAAYHREAQENCERNWQDFARRHRDGMIRSHYRRVVA